MPVNTYFTWKDCVLHFSISWTTITMCVEVAKLDNNAVASHSITTLLKMRSSGNPKIGVPATGQIKLQGKSYGNSDGE